MRFFQHRQVPAQAPEGAALQTSQSHNTGSQLGKDELRGIASAFPVFNHTASFPADSPPSLDGNRKGSWDLTRVGCLGKELHI